MTIIPPPERYKSEAINELMRRITPQNIDEVMAEIEKFRDKASKLDLVVRLSCEVSLEALRRRRAQYEECGAIENSECRTGG